MSQTYAEKRLEVIRRLGSKCSRCGFNDERALQIDHIHGGGVQESKRIGMPKYGIMLNMLKNTPELFHATYQVLCANCNWIKRSECRETAHVKTDDKLKDIIEQRRERDRARASGAAVPDYVFT